LLNLGASLVSACCASLREISFIKVRRLKINKIGYWLHFIEVNSFSAGIKKGAP
jgi:hypothetical protein